MHGSSDRECSENDIRLVRGQTQDDGQLQICLNGTWSLICSDRWDYRDASVVCQQLGYNGCESLSFFSLFNFFHRGSFFCQHLILCLAKKDTTDTLWFTSTAMVLRPGSVSAVVTKVVQTLSVMVERLE